MRNISDKVVEKTKTDILYKITFSRKSCPLIKQFSENLREATDDSIIRRMRFARWITKATDKH
jgi:hypothetical protein